MEKYVAEGVLSLIHRVNALESDMAMAALPLLHVQTDGNWRGSLKDSNYMASAHISAFLDGIFSEWNLKWWVAAFQDYELNGFSPADFVVRSSLEITHDDYPKIILYDIFDWHSEDAWKLEKSAYAAADACFADFQFILQNNLFERLIELAQSAQCGRNPVFPQNPIRPLQKA